VPPLQGRDCSLFSCEMRRQMEEDVADEG